MSLVQIVFVLANATFNWFVFPYAENHMREIFIGTAILYLVAFSFVCLVVKEGDYPPIEGETVKDSKGMGGIKTFFKECFTHKFYWLFFTAGAFLTISNAIGFLSVFFLRDMQLTDLQIGRARALGSVVTVTAMYFAAVFVDRWHPIRITVYVGVFRIVANVASWVWIFITLPGNCFFFDSAFLSALEQTARAPLGMRLLPKSRYAQFCSAQAMLQAACAMGAGICAGAFIDVIQHFCMTADFAYRFTFVWTLVFSTASAIVMLYIYRHWHRLGGFKQFHPPAPWSPKQVEEAPIVPTVGPQSRWLNIALRLFDAVMALSVLAVPFMMWWMHLKGTTLAFKWFGMVLLPLSVLTWLLWEYVKRSIHRDVKRARGNEPLRNGIPHHGMLMAPAITWLLMLPLWIVSIVVSVNLNMETAAVVFGLANVVTNVLLAGAVCLMCRVERGRSTTIDENPALETAQ
jgi:hypothetical protein